MSEHFEISKIRGDLGYTQCADESVIGVEVCYDLEAAFEGDDLSFEVFLDDPAIFNSDVRSFYGVQ